MAKKNKKYWEDRFEQLENATNKKAVNTYSTVELEYMKAQRQIEKEINDWYVRFANNNQISMQEARKWLNVKELKELKWDVQEYIKYGHENELNNIWMQELENASAKYHISRLEALKLRTQQSIEVLFGNQTDSIDDLMRSTYQDNYYQTVYEIQKGFNVGWIINAIDQDKLSKIVAKPWTADGKNFSDRLWSNKVTLIDEVHKQMTQMCIMGKAPDTAIKNIAKKFNTSKNQAGRLIMTESAYFTSASQKDCFNALDVEKYEIVATLDSHTSEVCQELDGQVFLMKDFQPGVTAPPFHVWCRSVTVPYFEDDYGERAARDEEGKTYFVPSTMKYNEWKEAFVNGEEGILETLTKIKNNITAKDITDQKESLIEQSFTNDNIKQIALDTNIKSIKMGNIQSRHKKGNVMLNETCDIKVVRHEIGHAVDYNNGWLSSNKNFLEAIEKDKKLLFNNPDKYIKLIKNNRQCAGLSDIIGGMTRNKIVGQYSHKIKYWEKPNKLERETFAQLFAMAGGDDLYQLNLLNEYLPNILEEFSNLIRGLL